jgi:hypothetical protein
VSHTHTGQHLQEEEKQKLFPSTFSVIFWSSHSGRPSVSKVLHRASGKCRGLPWRVHDGQLEKKYLEKNRPKMVNERCVCLFVSKLDESSFLYKYWVGNISSSLFPFNPVKQGLSIPPFPTISVYIRRRRGKETKKPVFLEWFQMKSDCSTRTVYLITSFDESNSFKLKTKKNGQQFFWSFNCALIRPSQRPVARKPTSDCQTHWTILCSELWIIFFFCFRFFSRRWLVFQPRLYCCVSIFIVIIIIAGATTTVYLAFPYP